MNAPADLSRRDFLAAARAAGALVLGVGIGRPARMETLTDDISSFSPNVWLSIATNGEINIWLSKAEMGQGVYTALPMLVGDELDAEWTRVRVLQADTEAQFAKFLGTGGSSSVRSLWEPLRLAGAAAREMLIATAAAEWKVRAEDCDTVPGTVVHAASGRRAPYGTLVKAASRLHAPSNPRLKERSRFRLIGTRVPRLDTPVKVDGSAIFGADIRVPDMLYGVVARCPFYGGALASYDASRARSMAGVRYVVPVRNTGVAVVADTTWAAFQGRQALDVRWNEGPHANFDSSVASQVLDECAVHPGVADINEGDVNKAFENCARHFTATYSLPFVAHEAIEPLNCTADVRQDKCEIWGPLQSSDAVQRDAAAITGLPLSAITVHTTFIGGGFGRKWPVGMDFSSEAIIVSQAIRRPVQLFWSREDDIAHDLFRPPSRHVMNAGLNTQGHLLAWSHRIVAPSLRAQPFSDGRDDEDIRRGLDKWATEAPVHIGYRPPNFRVEFVITPLPVPVGAWRSVYASQTAFADECFVDELAVACDKDPYTFRMELIGEKSPLHRAVLERVVQKIGWNEPPPAGRARGIAVHRYGENATYVAQVAEVSVDQSGFVRVHRVVCAIDCGAVVNPGIVEAQMEGAILYGLSAALMGEITFAGGRCRQSNFHDAKLLRFSQAPEIEVHILESERHPTGVGEPGVPVIAPAVANAVSAATGCRIRELPLTPARVKAVMDAKQSGLR
jgi:isoquinoline 1-oxidoreductase subunit beta